MYRCGEQLSDLRLPFMRNPDVRQDFDDPAEWEAALKALIRFRILDIKADQRKEFKATSSVLSCGELGILSVNAPTAFVCNKYEHDYATVVLPYRHGSRWWDGEQELVAWQGRSILYLAPGADLGIDSGDTTGVLVMIPRASLVKKAVAMSRGTLFASVIRSRLLRSHIFDSENMRTRELINGLYGCLFALEGVFNSGPQNVQYVSLDEVFLRVLSLLLFPELQAIDERESAYKPKLVRMKQLEDWIMANLASKISLSQLEIVSGYSARTLQDYFVQQHQKSPKQWITQQRLKKALQMLAGGDERPIANIAVDCGFRDSSRFAKMFNQEFGFLPRHCRSVDSVNQSETAASVDGHVQI